MVITKQIVLAAIDKCMIIGEDIPGTPDEKIICGETSAEAGIFLDHDLKICFVAFKGSKEIKDFIVDVRFHKSPAAWCPDLKTSIKIHSGFLEASLSIYHEVGDLLYSVYRKHSNYDLVYTGHSLGKSMAECQAFHEWNYYGNGFDCDAIIGFGGPLSGNYAFSWIMNEICKDNLQFINRKDVVPRLLKDKFKYFFSGIPIYLDDVPGLEGIPANVPVAIVNHDIRRDYENPIKKLNLSLNDNIIDPTPF